MTAMDEWGKDFEGGHFMIRLRLFGRCRIYHDPVSPGARWSKKERKQNGYS